MRPRPFSFLLIVLTAASLASSPARAVSGGDIGTLPAGPYRCERPGDVSARAGIRMEEHDFVILPSSSYRVGNRRGSYLLTGDDMVMTGGPFEGRAFLRTSVGFLRMLGPDGEPGAVRCVLGRRELLLN